MPAMHQDMNIYFDKASLLEYLSNLEEDNLFKIHLVQDDEQSLENANALIQKTIKDREDEISEVLKNIEMLEHSKAGLVSKKTFLE